MNELERVRQIYRQYGEPRRWRSSNKGNRLIMKEQTRAIGHTLRGYWGVPLPPKFTALDVGCGGGANLKRLIDLGADPRFLFGVDILPDQITATRDTLMNVNVLEADAARLPFAANPFDLVIISTVFSSIQEQNMMREIAAEVTRTLKDSGGILWYDIRYISYNRNVHPVTRRQLKAYFHGFSLRLRSLTVLPPLARRLPFLYPILNTIPLFRSHWFGLLTRCA